LAFYGFFWLTGVKYEGFAVYKAREQKFPELKKLDEKPLDKELKLCDNTVTVNKRANCSIKVSR
jgi:hypothetical protein